jgi:Mce-associated membrane protein
VNDEQRTQSQTQNQGQGQEASPSHRPSHDRNRLTADIQAPRRRRAVAGQRAAAKRAGGQAVHDEDQAAAVPAAAVATAAKPAQAGTALAQRPEPAKSTAAKSTASKSTAVPESEAEAAESESAADASETPDRPSRPRFARTRLARRTPRTSRTPGLRRAVVTAVLAAAVAGVLAAGAVLAVQYRDSVGTDHARTAAMAAALRDAPVIFSYDYRHLDQDFARAETRLTGTFRTQYAKTTQTVVKPTALQYHGVVKAVVAKPSDGGAPAVSVVSASREQVVVLVFVDQSTTSTRVSGTQVDQNRVLMTLTHTAQGWLVSAVDAL